MTFDSSPSIASSDTVAASGAHRAPRQQTQITKLGHSVWSGLRGAFQRDRLFYTSMQIVNLATDPVSVRSALLDHNPARLADSLYSPTMSLVSPFFKMGTKPPAGKTPLQKWWNALTHPNESTMYFGIAAALPMAAVNFGANIYYGIWGGRPEQLAQFALSATMLTTGVRAYWNRAVTAEAEIALKEGRAISEPDSGAPTNSLKGKIVKALDHPFFSSRHTSFGMSMGIISFRLAEGINLLRHNSIDGRCMIEGTALALATGLASKVWQEMQWDKSLNRPYFWNRAAESMRQQIGRAQDFLAGHKPNDIWHRIQEKPPRNKSPSSSGVSLSLRQKWANKTDYFKALIADASGDGPAPARATPSAPVPEQATAKL